MDLCLEEVWGEREMKKLYLQFGELDNVKGQTVKGANHTSPNFDNGVKEK